MNFTNVGKCSKLPESMNGGAYPIGCPGAVWSDGNSSDKYCAGLDFSGAMSYPWWKDCCKWDGTKCVPKGDMYSKLQVQKNVELGKLSRGQNKFLFCLTKIG